MSELPEQITSLLNPTEVDNGLVKLLEHVLHALRVIGTGLRSCEYLSDKIGTTNEFGDSQLDVDVKADAVLFSALRDSGVVVTASSEEKPHELPLGGTSYSVAFDPLDGSSIIDANFAVGTILGIWPGSTMLNRTGREQVCSVVAQFGPRVTAAIAFNSTATVDGQMISLEVTMHTEGWVVTVPRLQIAPAGNTFAPGNLRATTDNPQYKALVDYWISNQYTLRYSGGLVPDIYHILMKGQGVMSNASSKKCRAKLRLLFECAPIALVIEAAGGESCACPSEEGEPMPVMSLLDVPIDHLDRRVGVCFGSAEEVQRFRQHIFA